MLCGGTLVFNDNGNVLSWMMKPGSEPYGGKRRSAGARRTERWAAAVKEGTARRSALLEHLAAQIAAGRDRHGARDREGIDGVERAADDRG